MHMWTRSHLGTLCTVLAESVNVWQKGTEKSRNELKVLGVAPDFLAPVFDELGVLAVFGLEVLEAAAEDQDLVGDVLAVALELVARL